MTTLTLSERTQRLPRQYPRAFLSIAALLWWALYRLLAPASETLVAALPVDRQSRLGGALQFFVYDTPKLLLLLTGSHGQRREGLANVMAATLGIVTPFCSRSAVPLLMERHLEDWVRDLPRVHAATGDDRLTLAERIEAGFASMHEIVGKVWPWILAGITIGAAIHGWVPEDFMAAIMGKQAWWSVPLAVLIGPPIVTFAGIAATGLLLVGFVFNAVI